MGKTFRGNRFDPDWPLRVNGVEGGRVVNVGATGLRFTWPRSLDIGQMLRLQIDAGGGTPVECAARVVWKRSTRPPQYGAEFDLMSEADREALFRQLSALLQNRVNRKQAAAASERKAA